MIVPAQNPDMSKLLLWGVIVVIGYEAVKKVRASAAAQPLSLASSDPYAGITLPTAASLPGYVVPNEGQHINTDAFMSNCPCGSYFTSQGPLSIAQMQTQLGQSVVGMPPSDPTIVVQQWQARFGGYAISCC